MINLILKTLCKSNAALVLALSYLFFCVDAGAVEFTSKERKDLSEGETVFKVFSKEGRDGYFGGSGWAVIDSPVEEVWTAIQDWNSYTEIFTNVVEIKELYRKRGRSFIKMKVGHPLISVSYVVEMHPDKASWTLKFKQIEHRSNDFDDIRGYWKLLPLDDGCTLVAYILGVNVPMGIVNVLPEYFRRIALEKALCVPGVVREWMDGEGRGRYKRKKS